MKVESWLQNGALPTSKERKQHVCECCVIVAIVFMIVACPKTDVTIAKRPL